MIHAVHARKHAQRAPFRALLSLHTPGTTTTAHCPYCLLLLHYVTYSYRGGYHHHLHHGVGRHADWVLCWPLSLCDCCPVTVREWECDVPGYHWRRTWAQQPVQVGIGVAVGYVFCFKRGFWIEKGVFVSTMVGLVW